MWVPHAYESVHASSDQQAVLLTKVKCLDTFVDGENRLVTRCPQLWCPAQLDLLGLTFIAGLSDLTQLLLGVCQRQHTASGGKKEKKEKKQGKKAFYYKAMSIYQNMLFGARVSH